MGARVVNVEITPVAPVGFVDYIRLTGEVEAFHDITVSAEESGRIARFAVEKGANVATGDLIAKIDDAILVPQVAEARAVASVAREQYERQRRLLDEENVGSEIVVLQLESANEAAAARLALLEERLRRTEIRAPVAGIFDERHVEAGELVAPGTPIARVVAVRRVKVIGGVPERYALDIQTGDSARITFDVLPGREFVGVISFVGATIEPGNRTIPIEVVLDNRERLVKPHMVANVQVVRERLDEVIVVPQDVVLRTEDGYQVYLVSQREGQLRTVARPVVLGPAYGNHVVVRSGLALGDSLIVVGHRLVDDGSYVRIVGAGGER
jgi:membrane fusion protein (multidrug efflux system)